MPPPDIHQHDGDVVGSPGIQSHLQQSVGGAGGSEICRECLGRLGVGDDAAQPVRAQEPAVTGLSRHDEGVDLGVRRHVTEHAHQHRGYRCTHLYYLYTARDETRPPTANEQ